MAGYTVTEAPQVEYFNLNLDESGFFFLIKPDFSTGKIQVVIKNDLEIKEVVTGNRCQDIYNYIIFNYEQYLSKLHCCYLGKELKKAEIAMVTGGSYYQE